MPTPNTPGAPSALGSLSSRRSNPAKRFGTRDQNFATPSRDCFGNFVERGTQLPKGARGLGVALLSSPDNFVERIIPPGLWSAPVAFTVYDKVPEASGHSPSATSASAVLCVLTYGQNACAHGNLRCEKPMEPNLRGPALLGCGGIWVCTYWGWGGGQERPGDWLSW